MGAVITTGSHPKLLWPGIRALAGMGYKEKELQYPKLFDVVKSDMAYEEEVMTQGFGLLPIKPQGGSVSYQTQVQGYIARYINVAYASGFIVTYEELRDNKYPKLAAARAKALGRSKRQTKETVAANVYNRAHTAGYTGGDGVVLCSTSHPCSSGDQSNTLATTADLSEKTIEDMLIQISQALDDKGMRIGLMAQALIVHPSNWYEANRIYKSTLQNDSANNAINALRATNAFPGGIVMNNYLSDADSFFIRTDCPDGLKFQERDDIDLRQDNDGDTYNLKASTYARFAAGWTDWRGVYSNGGGA